MDIPELDLSNIGVKPQDPDLPRKFLLVHYKDDEYTLTIDHSSISLFTECDKKAEYALVHGRIGHEKAALSYGKAVHLALETYYKGERDMGKILLAGLPEFEEKPSWRPRMAHSRTLWRNRREVCGEVF